MPTTFLNGRFLDDAETHEAVVSAFDAGFQHGIGLFETMTGGVNEAGAPWVIGLEEHLERLDGSARLLSLSESLRLSALADAVLATVERSGLTRARVRLTITGGDLNMLSRPLPGSGTAPTAPPGQPTILIVAQPATSYPPEMFERGVLCTIADYKANPLDPFAGHKTLHYWPRLRELQLAASKRAAEALVFQVTNFLAGGCVSNAFIVSGGRLITPIARGEENESSSQQQSTGIAVPSPVLPGITREWVFGKAAELRLPVERRMITIDQVLGADEVFLTNSSWGVLPVIGVEAHTIGNGTVGTVTSSLTEAWKSMLTRTANEDDVE
jgi:branched-chain amino acid aminotransferase